MQTIQQLFNSKLKKKWFIFAIHIKINSQNLRFSSIMHRYNQVVLIKLKYQIFKFAGNFEIRIFSKNSKVFLEIRFEIRKFELKFDRIQFKMFFLNSHTPSIRLFFFYHIELCPSFNNFHTGFCCRYEA